MPARTAATRAGRAFCRLPWVGESGACLWRTLLSDGCVRFLVTDCTTPSRTFVPSSSRARKPAGHGPQILGRWRLLMRVAPLSHTPFFVSKSLPALLSEFPVQRETLLAQQKAFLVERSSSPRLIELGDESLLVAPHATIRERAPPDSLDPAMTRVRSDNTNGCPDLAVVAHGINKYDIRGASNDLKRLSVPNPQPFRSDASGSSVRVSPFSTRWQNVVLLKISDDRRQRNGGVISWTSMGRVPFGQRGNCYPIDDDEAEQRSQREKSGGHTCPSRDR
jgi:hypothetical protein